MIAVVLFWGGINGLLCGGCAALDNRSDLRYNAVGKPSKAGGFGCNDLQFL